MSTYRNDGSLLGKLITWLLVALLAIAALKLAFWVLGVALGIGGLLLAVLLRLAPLLLLGWLVMKLVRAFSRPEY